MLDFDLAEIYGIENKYLKRSVRRNMERFEGDDFMFELTKDEANVLKDNIRCKFGTLDQSWFRYPPFAFTELGVAMLSSVLNSETAITTNRNIMRAFVAIRHAIYPAIPITIEDRVKALEEANELLLKDINDLSEDMRSQFDDIYITLSEMAERKKLEDKPRNPIGFRK
jgi:hypothetical protein